MKIDFPAPHHLPQQRQLWQDAFGDTDAFLDSFFQTAYSADRCRCVFMGEDIAAILYWIDCTVKDQKLAYIYAVVTHPGHRGKGLCRKLMADTHNLLVQSGYDSVMLVPADTGLREMYRKMGYDDCTTVSSLICTAGETPADVRSIGVEEYTRLRRKLLPETGVLQEEENLSFLSAQAQLLAGADFLLAAWLEGDTLHGTELLGNTEAAPQILRALGCRRGTFQIPGNAKPFARKP